MSTPQETQPKRERTWIYVTSCVMLALVVVAALIVFESARDTAQAGRKADELIAALQEAGAHTPDRDQIIRVLGEDGGATCEDPNEALSRATLLSQVSNGATGPGARPVISDERIFQGQLLIIEIYCPDELDEFTTFVEDLKTADVAGD
jgi:hypothetical protein